MTSARVIKVAAALAERYANPDVAAFGRVRSADYRMWSGKFRRANISSRTNVFWHSVGHALHSAYGFRSAPTNHEIFMRQSINAARAQLNTN